MTSLTWTGLAKDNKASTPGNWNPAQVPASSDVLVVSTAGATLDFLGFTSNPSVDVNASNVTLLNSNKETINIAPNITNTSVNNTKNTDISMNGKDLTLTEVQSGTEFFRTVLPGSRVTENIAVNASSGIAFGSPMSFSITVNGGSASFRGGDILSTGVLIVNSPVINTPGFNNNFTLEAGGKLEFENASAASVTTLNGSTFIDTSPINYTGSIHYSGGTVDFTGLTSSTHWLYDAGAKSLALEDASNAVVRTLQFDAKSGFVINKTATDLVITPGATADATGNIGTGQVPPPPPPPPSHLFTIVDTTKGTDLSSDGENYIGPIVGVTKYYITANTDSLNITATVPNVFIHSGSGQDGLAVLSGRNVLDGSTNSNFLTGSALATSQDTFYVDARNATTNVWSSVINFHTGDDATMWGVSVKDFYFTWLDNQGAVGFTGLTLVATPKQGGPQAPQAALTLAGFTTADLSNGKLSGAFGVDTVGSNDYLRIAEIR